MAVNSLGWVPLATIAVVLAVQVPVNAAFITTVTPTVTPLGQGEYDFNYQVANSSDSTVDIGEFDLKAVENADLSDVVIPSGFISLYTPGDVDVQFQSTDSSTDILPGETETFSFVSEVGPAIGLDDTLSFDDGSVNNGTTLTPTAPEPAAAVLIIAGAVLVRRRRRP